VHTIIVLAVGFVLLGLCSLVGRLLGGTSGLATATLVFLPLWLFGAGVNMYVGVTKAGYSVTDEAPIFLVVFLIPVAAALALWWKLR
jgi:hypothetical protein